MEMDGKGISRRRFLAGAAAAGAVAAITTMSNTAFASEGAQASSSASKAASASASAAASSSKSASAGASASAGTSDIFYTSDKTSQIGVVVEPASTEDVDLVAVGSGMAGLSAAVMAKELMPDAKVVLLEKASVYGGLTRYCNCPFGHSETFPVNMAPADARKMVKEKEDESSYGCYGNLYYGMYTEWGDTSAWLVGKQGVGIEYTPKLYGGHTVCYKGGTAESMLDTMVGNAETLGVELRLDSRATALITTDPYTVTGVQYEDADGNVVQLNARAVLLGTGCISANPELVQQHYFLDPDEFVNFGLGDDTGDGQVMVQATAHGRIREISYAFKDYALGTGFYDATVSGNLLAAAVGREPTALIVNENGVRPRDESIYAPKSLIHSAKNFSIFGSTAIEHLINNGLAMGVNLSTCDYTGNPLPMNDLLDQYADADWLYKADTIEELGKAIAAKVSTFDVDAFVQQISDYDGYAASGVDEQWGKDGSLLWPIGDGPYYAAQVLPMMLHAGGGVDINMDAQVIDPNGVPIVGLYAVGNTGGPWGGETYLTGAGQNTALWSSTRAVHHAVKNIFDQEIPEDWMGDLDPTTVEIPTGEFPTQFAHVEVDTSTGRAV